MPSFRAAPGWCATLAAAVLAARVHGQTMPQRITFRKGAVTRYAMRVSSTTTAMTPLATTPITTRVAMATRMQATVQQVLPGGSARVELRVSDTTMTINGRAQPAPSRNGVHTVQIGPDGRAGGGSQPTSLLPGVGLLPHKAVGIGGTWTMAGPAAGLAGGTATCRFTRVTSVNGARAAHVHIVLRGPISAATRGMGAVAAAHPSGSVNMTGEADYSMADGHLIHLLMSGVVDVSLNSGAAGGGPGGGTVHSHSKLTNELNQVG